MTGGIVLNLALIATAQHDRAARASLARAAELAVASPMLSVAQKPSAPAGGSLNDYWSVGPYWWPDPAKADGLPYVRRDGHVNPDFFGERYDRGRLGPFCKSIATLALAAMLGEFGGAVDGPLTASHTAKMSREGASERPAGSGPTVASAFADKLANERDSRDLDDDAEKSSPATPLASRDFAASAVARLRVWFIDPSTRMNPNLRFGQSIPGICDGRGIGLIDTHDLINVVDACVMLRRIGALGDADFAAIQSWFSEFLDWMLTHPYGIAERNEHNNHATWCDAQLAAFALFAGRKEIAREVIAAVPARRIDTQILPDGRQPHELARTRSLSYSSMNLNGFFTLARMGRHVGVDLWSYRSADGRSLRGAVDFLALYAAADRPWPFPELEAEVHLPPARTRLSKILRQAGIAWRDGRYIEQAESCEAAGNQDFARLYWPIDIADQF